MDSLIIFLVCLGLLAGPVGLILGIVALRRVSRLRREVGLAGQAVPADPGRPAYRTAAAPAPIPPTPEVGIPGASAPTQPHPTPPPPPPPPRAKRPSLTWLTSIQPCANGLIFGCGWPTPAKLRNNAMWSLAACPTRRPRASSSRSWTLDDVLSTLALTIA